MALLGETGFVRQHPRHQTQHRIRHRQRGQLAASQDEIPQRNLLVHQLLDHPLVNPLIMAAQESDMPPFGKLHRLLLGKPFPLRGKVDEVGTGTAEGLENAPRKFAISKRNRWLIEHCDTVIAYVKYSTGGAAQFKELAEKKQKWIINIAIEREAHHGHHFQW